MARDREWTGDHTSFDVDETLQRTEPVVAAAADL
jgi:hypothetical protein